jgi:hypothetical protein
VAKELLNIDINKSILPWDFSIPLSVKIQHLMQQFNELKASNLISGDSLTNKFYETFSEMKLLQKS